MVGDEKEYRKEKIEREAWREIKMKGKRERENSDVTKGTAWTKRREEGENKTSGQKEKDRERNNQK